MSVVKVTSGSGFTTLLFVFTVFTCVQGFDYREVFRRIDDDFRSIMRDAHRDNRVVAILKIG